MTQPQLDRRTAGLMALAATIWPGMARADLVANPLPARPAPAPADAPADIGMFSDLYRRMTAPVRINGAGPFAFVVDTGANRTVISAELADRLGLPRGADQPVNDAAGVAVAPTVTARVSVGGQPDSELVLSVLPQAGIGGLGMLGLDRLTDRRLTLDFRGGRLRIDGARAPSRDRPDVVVPARRRFGQLTVVDADLEGAPISAFLDSGSQTTIGNPPLRTLARARDSKAVWSVGSIESASGQSIPADIATLPHLRVGGLVVQGLSVAFADLHTFRLWGLGARPAILLGVDVLSRFDAVELDFARGEVRFRLPAAA